MEGLSILGASSPAPGLKIGDVVKPGGIAGYGPASNAPPSKGYVTQVYANGDVDIEWRTSDGRVIFTSSKVRPVSQNGASAYALRTGTDDFVDFMKRPALGPLPMYGVLLGGVGVLGVLGFAVKRALAK